MRDWAKLFKSYLGSGIYPVKPAIVIDQIRQSAMSCGLTFVYIDLLTVTTKEAFLQSVSKSLQFPLYFGMNWDAFQDCITDLAWFPVRGYVIWLDNLASFKGNAPDEMRTARKVLKFTADYWKNRSMPFYVLLGEK